MNDCLIANWNNTVTNNDVVFVLGDFALGKNKVPSKYWLDKLNGKEIHIVAGNHDNIEDLKSAGFDSVSNFLEIVVNYKYIALCHYAFKVWNYSHKNSWCLFGHSHNTLIVDENSLSMDVGVDACGYKPISFKEIAHIMKSRTFKPVDHHDTTTT